MYTLLSQWNIGVENKQSTPLKIDEKALIVAAESILV